MGQVKEESAMLVEVRPCICTSRAPLFRLRQALTNRYEAAPVIVDVMEGCQQY